MLQAQKQTQFSFNFSQGKFDFVHIFFQQFSHLPLRENRKEPQILQPGDATLLEQSYFNKSLPTKIDAHGFGGRPSSSYGARDGM